MLQKIREKMSDWKYRLTLAVPLTGFAVGCGNGIETIKGDYQGLRVNAERNSEGKKYALFLIDDYKATHGGIGLNLITVLFAKDRDGTGSFDEDEITIDSFPLNQAKVFNRRGIKNFSRLLPYANPDSLDKIFDIVAGE